MVKKFISYYKPHWKLFSLDILAALTISSIDLIFPMLSREVINNYIPNSRLDLIIKTAIFLIILYIIKAMCNYFVAYWGHVVGSRIEYDMRNKLFAKFQKLEFAFFDNNKTGNLINRLMGDLNLITELAHHGPEDLFISIVMIIGSFLILLNINVLLTLIIFVFVIFVIVFSVTKRKSMSRAFRNVRSKQAELLSKLEGSISGIRLATTFANEDYEVEKFKESNFEYLDSKKESFNAIGKYTSGNNFFIDIMTLSTMIFGGIFVYYGKINYGDLVAYMLYISFFTAPIKRLVQFVEQFQGGMAGFERYLEVLEIDPAIKDADNAVELESIKGNIKFNEVSFRYEEDSELVLDKFNLTIDHGKVIALVGKSGVGKTTISQIIPRFYDVTEGSVTIDGIDVRNIKLNSLRNNIGVVQQDVFMFYGSIKDNIEYGKPGASKEEIYDAAKKANIHEFIMGLDNGYDEKVGERGVKLSGGQKQRIAIARVFLKNPPMLILDEATSALDNENEIAIQESFDELSKGRTTIIIAHRLSTIKNADEILVFTEDGIAEKGSHDDLIKVDKIYKKLYSAQFRGFIPDEVNL